MDRFSDSISEVKVVGTVDRKQRDFTSSESGGSSKAAAVLGASPAMAVEVSVVNTDKMTAEDELKRSGVERPWIDFGYLSRTLDQVIKATGLKRFWIMID